MNNSTKNNKTRKNALLNVPGKKTKKSKNRVRKPFRPNEVPTYGDQIISQMQHGYGKTLQMVPTTANFAKVYSDPFTKESARIPVFPIVSSQLERFFCSGSSVANAQGYGWITVTPSFTMTNVGGVAVSTAASGNSILSSNWDTIGTSSPYKAGDFAEGTGYFSARIVSAGIRIRYTGTTLNSSGQVYCFQMSPLGTSNASLTIPEIKQIPGYKQYAFNNSNWHTLTRHVMSTEDTWFMNYNPTLDRFEYANSDNSSDDNNNRLGIIFLAYPGASFDWEYVVHVELIGRKLSRQGVGIPDTQGFESTVGTFAKLRHQDTTTKDHNAGGTWSTLVGLLKKGVKTLVPMIPSALEKLSMLI